VIVSTSAAAWVIPASVSLVSAISPSVVSVPSIGLVAEEPPQDVGVLEKGYAASCLICLKTEDRRRNQEPGLLGGICRDKERLESFPNGQQADRVRRFRAEVTNF
jgi:hypothetical protein